MDVAKVGDEIKVKVDGFEKVQRLPLQLEINLTAESSISTLFIDVPNYGNVEMK